MSDAILDVADGPAIPLTATVESGLEAALRAAGPMAQGLARTAEFKGKAGQVLVIPGADGAAAAAIAGLGAGRSHQHERP